jgi:hypothetical protein
LWLRPGAYRRGECLCGLSILTRKDLRPYTQIFDEAAGFAKEKHFYLAEASKTKESFFTTVYRSNYAT